MSDVAALYQQLILEHHKNPRNGGRLSDATHAGDANNPLCGDRLTLTLRIGGERLLEARCDVQGCAICRASGSMMTEAISGMHVREALVLVERFMAVIAGSPGASSETGPLTAFSEVRRFPTRVRCATLCWETLQRLLAPFENTSDTTTVDKTVV